MASNAKTFNVTTFGCQMNQHDSERMKGMLESLGYDETDNQELADLILFNTCSIRESADQRLISHLGNAKRIKGQNPELIIGVGGCWAQSVKEEIFEKFPFVDVAFGPGQFHKLAEFLNSDSLSAQGYFEFDALIEEERRPTQHAKQLLWSNDSKNQKGYFEFEGFTGRLPHRRQREYQAWVQISVGCNSKCAYCIVPSTRGREVSRAPSELLEEISQLARDGVKEVTLLGQNVNSYGRDLLKDDRASFSELLAQIDAIDGIQRVRYTSPHPKDMREDVIKAHAELPSLCEQIHLPLQSGSSRILKAMRRTYNRERYMQRIDMIRKYVPDCSITTDIIVGFPGESEADFNETLEIVDQVGYDSAFTFIFSPRRGTEAAELPDHVPHAVKQERMERLIKLVHSRSKERGERFIGRNLEVLVEGTSRTDATKLRGRSRHGSIVNFEGVSKPGELVEVEITGATSKTLSGVQKLLSAVAV